MENSIMIFLILITLTLFYTVFGLWLTERDIYRMKRERKKRQEDIRLKFERECEDADYLELKDQKRKITDNL